MFRVRTRPVYSSRDLERIYSYQHDHSVFPDHILRIEETIGLAEEFLDPYNVSSLSAADLSCGDATVPYNWYWDDLHLGDYLRSERTRYVGPIEKTIHEIPHVDFFFLLETLEHLDDPEAVLRDIREKSDRLVLSTPDCDYRDDNPEHYWAWDSEAVHGMLTDTGWGPQLYRHTTPELGYRFQIWGCV